MNEKREEKTIKYQDCYKDYNEKDQQKKELGNISFYLFNKKKYGKDLDNEGTNAQNVNGNGRNKNFGSNFKNI